MRIAVIGGTQFIGAALVRRLCERGHEVAICHRGRTPGDPPAGVTRITADRDALAAAREPLKRFGPDVVLHNVVISERHAAIALDALRDVAPRLVMTSSCDVYLAYGRMHGLDPGPPVATPIDEDAPLRESRFPYRAHAAGESDPMWDYDKIPAERRVLEADRPRATVLRLPMVVGPDDPQRRLAPFVRPMLGGRAEIELPEGYARWTSTYDDVRNVAEAMALACTDPRALGRVFNVGDWHPSVLELGRRVAAELEWSGRFALRPPEEIDPPFDTRHDLVCSAERIRAELGYRPLLSLDESIRDVVAWERAAG